MVRIIGNKAADGLPAEVELVCDAKVLAHQVHDVAVVLHLLPRHVVNTQLFRK